jgi:hypothetical protein
MPDGTHCSNPRAAATVADTATVVAGRPRARWWCHLPLPDSGAWLFIALSTFIHFGYYLTLAQAQDR